MQTLSSARRTCMASASAVEWTAAVAMPSSLQARCTRRAISPRLAIRTLSNMARSVAGNRSRQQILEPPLPVTAACYCPSFNDDQRLAEFHGLAIVDQDRRDGSGLR